MKRILFIMGATALMLASCSKEKGLNAHSDSVKKVDIDVPISVEHEMLSFSTFDDYLSARDELQNAGLRHFADYQALYSDQSEKKFNDQIIADDFDVYKIFRSFEADYAYVSLRKVMEGHINNWLNDAQDGDLDMSQNPDKHAIMGEAERTLFNKHGELKIGERIYVFKDDVTYFVDNSDFGIIDEIRNGTYDWGTTQESHVKLRRDVPTSSCRTNLNTHQVLNTLGNTVRIDWRLSTMVMQSITSFGVISEHGSTHRKISAYSKQFDGSWLRFYPTIERNGQEIYTWYETDCLDQSARYPTNHGSTGNVTTSGNFGVIVASSPTLNTALTIRGSSTENVGKYKWNTPLNGVFTFFTYMNI